MQPIRVGLLFSLTGTTSLTEIGQYQAALYAVEQFKRDHDELDLTITVEIKDIRSDPRESYRQALEMAQSGVKLFVGCYTSACRRAILPILEEYNCLLVYPTLYEGQEIHPNVFYIGEVPNQQIDTLLHFMIRQFGKRVYLIGNDYIYPRYTNQQIREMLKDLGGTVAGEQYVALGHTQFNAILEDIERTSPDLILSTLVGESVTHFYREYYELGLNPGKLPILSPTTTELEIKSMGAKYAAGHYSCSSYFQSLDNPENGRFVQGLKALYGESAVVSSAMASAYTGVYMMLDASVSLLSTKKELILKNLHKKTYDSPSGPVQMESNHHLSREVRIGQANLDGQFTIIWSSGEAIPARPLMTNSILDYTVGDSTWITLIELIGEESLDGLVVLDQKNTVLYVNSNAYAALRTGEGDILRERQLEELSSTYEWTKKSVDESSLYTLLTLRKINNPPAFKKITPTEKFQFGRIVTQSPLFQKELHAAKIASKSDANVLILGETGSGKEVLARTIHDESPRRHGPFIALNAGAIPRELIASELFGYAEGAFTGSRKGGSVGKFEAADGGTLFLDEIGEMPPDFQVHLLRVLEERKVVRVGDNKERSINVRVIAATNRNLKEEIAYQGSFRSDLYYRLNVFTIQTLSLNKRTEDIEQLSYQFLQSFREHYGGSPVHLANSVLQAFRWYSWPGNIRELRNVLERAFLMAINETTILDYHLPSEFHQTERTRTPSPASNLKDMEQRMIKEALKGTESISEAAKRLGITRSTLYRKMNQWNIQKV